MKAFDSKGININIGDRVWNIEGYGPSGIVEAITEYNGRVSGVKYRTDQGYLHIADPSFLTHDEVPPRDTWESIAEDLKKDSCEYFDYQGKPCDGCPAFDVPACELSVRADIVRRAKALAEKEAER